MPTKEGTIERDSLRENTMSITTVARKARNKEQLTTGVKGAARLSGIGEATLYRAAKTDPNFPCMKFGKKIIIPIAAFQAWLNSCAGKIA